MSSLKLMSIVFASALLLSCGQKATQDSAEPVSPEQAAVQSAEAWLALVDDGKYGDSWKEAAALFKNAVTKEKWAESMDGARSPLGKLIQRSVASSSYKTSLPGAPDGEYVVIQFQTEFEHKASAIETVTPLKEENGSWRVSGYYIN